MSVMLYVLMICLVVPAYLYIMNNEPIIQKDEELRARFNLISPIVGLFSPVICVVIVMVLIILYVAYLKEMWEKSFSQKKGDK